MSLGLLGKKLGMTHIYDDKGKAVAVTVVDVSQNEVTQVKNTETDGYSAVQIGFIDKRESRSTKPEIGHFKKAGSAPKYHAREFRVEAGSAPEVGTKLDLARAYMDMGDPEGARSILDEVLQEGSSTQRQEAERLIASLP